MENPRLRDAAEAGDVERLRELIAEEGVFGGESDSRQSALAGAAAEGHLAAVELLLDAGADPNRGDPHGTPLGAAAAGGYLPIVDLLLNRGADPNASSDDGRTALMIAAGEGKWTVVERILSAGAEVNATDARGTTALHCAAAAGKTGIVELLIQTGADPNLADAAGYVPLHGATNRGKLITIRALLDAGADANRAALDGVSPLLTAVVRNRFDLVQALLDAGADANACFQRNDEFFADLTKGATSLHVAAARGDLDGIEMLLRADADPNLRNDRGQTALDVARHRGHGPIIDRLEERTRGSGTAGADPASLARRLFRAAAAGRTEELVALLDQGAPRDAVFEDPAEGGSTALIAACREGHVECVRALLGAGADVDKAAVSSKWGHDGEFPLLAAVDAGHGAIVALLLDAGANPEASDPTGDTPLLRGVSSGHIEVVERLLDAGADPSLSAADVLQRASHGDDPDDEPEEESHSQLDALSLALSCDHDALAGRLLDRGVVPAPKALLIAAQRGKASLVARLLDLGIDVSGADGRGRTALHEACEIHACVFERNPRIDILQVSDHDRYLSQAARWQLETVRLLLERGADPNRTDDWGRTPLHSAAGMATSVSYCHARAPDGGKKVTFGGIDTAAVCRLLIDAGARVEARDCDGATPLFAACRLSPPVCASHLPVVDLLLSSGADASPTDASGRSPLHVALTDAAIAQRLIDAGAEVNTPDGQGCTPLMQAIRNASYGSVSVVRRLLDAGADVNAAGADGESCLDIAQDRRDTELVGLLQAAGARFANEKERRLHEAVCEGDPEGVEAALAEGARPHGIRHRADIFMTAVSLGRSDTIRLMMEAGADVNRHTPDLACTTPLTAALHPGRFAYPRDGIDPMDAVTLLLDGGADPNVPDKLGRSPLLLAAWMGRPGLVESLRRAGALANDPLTQDFLSVLQLEELARDADFSSAIDLLRQKTGEEPRPIQWRPGARAFFVEAGKETEEAMRRPENQDIAGFNVEWDVLNEKIRSIQSETAAALAALGAMAVDMGRPVGCGPSGKFLVLLPTTNQFTALAACGPSPGDDQHLPEVVKWFRELHDELPFKLWGAGRDFVDIEFEAAVSLEQSRQLAERINEFCPDAVDQGAGTKANLARQIHQIGRVYFWWD